MKVLSFITCEDVRREEDKKVSLIGTFDNLTIPAKEAAQGPVTIRLATHLRFLLESSDSTPSDVEFIIRSDSAQILEGNAPLDITDRSKPVALAGAMVLLQVRAPATVGIEYRFKSETGAPPPSLAFEFSVSIGDGARTSTTPA